MLSAACTEDTISAPVKLFDPKINGTTPHALKLLMKQGKKGNLRINPTLIRFDDCLLEINIRQYFFRSNVSDRPWTLTSDLRSATADSQLSIWVISE